jgi:pimeloyl-ACP methyl ester carboxylesterase
MLKRTFIFYSKFLLSFLLTISLVANSVAAQTKRQTAAQNSANQQTSVKKCDGAWSGIVNYKRVLKTDYAEGTSDFLKKNYVGASSSKQSSREVVYEGKIILDGKADPNIPQYGANIGGQYIGATQQKGKVAASVNENENRSAKSVQRDNCGANDTRDKTCESTETSKASANVSGESNFGLTFQNGVYSFSFRFPEAGGTKTVTKQSSCKNFCQGRNNGGGSTSETFPFRYDQQSVSISNQKYDPKTADRLQGSWTETSRDGSIITTVDWNLRKCAAPLQIIDLRFEHHQFPNPDEWIAVSENTGTVDGNQVKVKAIVFNSTPTEQNVTVNFTETKENIALPNGKVTAKIGAGETKEVEYVWDTNGFAWTDARKPQPAREIKAEITDDSRTENIKIIPKPVILAHGLWSNAAAWADWHSYLREAHTFAWEAFPVGENPSVAKMNTGDHPGNYEPTNTIYQNAQELGKQIKWVREQKNAWHVDVVAHSMGGLISRQYIDTMMPQVPDGKPEIAHLVMLGTPNQGSPCADLASGTLEFFGQKNMHALRELRPSVVEDFNKRVTARRNVRFSILIGYAVPITCQANVRGDGVVPILSALYNNGDIGFVFRDHISLTNEQPFKDFVLPRLAVGPKKARSEKASARFDLLSNDNFAGLNELDSAQNKSENYRNYFQDISFNPQKITQITDSDEPEKLTVKEKIILKSREMREIQIPANADGNTGILLLASPEVSAILTDENGTILGTSASGAESGKNLFRIISTEKSNGKILKLKLENTGALETAAIVAGFNGGNESKNFTVEAGKTSAAGVTTLQAKWFESNLPVLGAKITAKIAGEEEVITFFDDGKHNDSASGDGIYGASVEKLKKGDNLLQFQGIANEKTVSTAILIKIEK